MEGITVPSPMSPLDPSSLSPVSAEPGAVRVGEFGKERKRGKVKMTGDVLTTACDSERVEKGGDEDETREARRLRDPDEVLHVGKGDRPKEGARS
jgi:hypothetical protein